MKLHAVCMACLCALVSGTALAGDVTLDTAGPIGSCYVEMYYGLVDGGGGWVAGSDFFGDPSTTWTAIVDTGASAFVMSDSVRQAYAAGGNPVPLQAGLTFDDTGFGGSEQFLVTAGLNVMVAPGGEYANTEDHTPYRPYAPLGQTQTVMAVRQTAGEFIDPDILGMSLLEGRVLHVQPNAAYLSPSFLVMMPGSLEDPAPAAGSGALFVPVALQHFLPLPQTVDIGRHPVLPMRVRAAAADDFASRSAIFDSGSPVNFVSESFALEAGIDLSSPDLSIPVGGIGPESTWRDGYYVDAVALALGNGREGDSLLLGNSAVFVIPDDEMPAYPGPGGETLHLEAILGNGVFSPGQDDLFSFDINDSPFTEWYVDTRDPDHSYIVLVAPLPKIDGDANRDGRVDYLDLGALAGNYRKSSGATWAMGDFTEDGAVDYLDLGILAGNYRYGTRGASAPEPATLLLLIPLALLRRRRHA